MGFGYVEWVTHDRYRHGATTFFAALNAATGTVIAHCQSRRRHQQLLAFLRHTDQNVPGELDMHLPIDKYDTYKHARVRAWLADRPLYHVRDTPTYPSRFNQVER